MTWRVRSLRVITTRLGNPREQYKGQGRSDDVTINALRGNEPKEDGG